MLHKCGLHVLEFGYTVLVASAILGTLKLLVCLVEALFVVFVEQPGLSVVVRSCCSRPQCLNGYPRPVPCSQRPFRLLCLRGGILLWRWAWAFLVSVSKWYAGSVERMRLIRLIPFVCIFACSTQVPHLRMTLTGKRWKSPETPPDPADEPAQPKRHAGEQNSAAPALASPIAASPAPLDLAITPSPASPAPAPVAASPAPAPFAASPPVVSATASPSPASSDETKQNKVQYCFLCLDLSSPVFEYSPYSCSLSTVRSA